MPCTQAWSGPQTRWQPPQFDGSLRRSTHAEYCWQDASGGEQGGGEAGLGCVRQARKTANPATHQQRPQSVRPNDMR